MFYVEKACIVNYAFTGKVKHQAFAGLRRAAGP